MLRPYRSVRSTEGFVRDDRCRHAEPIEQRAPLGHEHGRHDECERLPLRERDGERHVGLAQAHRIGEERAAVTCEDRTQPLRGGDLVRREPRRPRLRPRFLQRRLVEQRARRAARDCTRRRLAPARAERDRKRLRDRDEVLSEDRVHGGRAGRARTPRRRRRRRTRGALRGWRARSTRTRPRRAPASRARRGR